MSKANKATKTEWITAKEGFQWKYVSKPREIAEIVKSFLRVNPKYFYVDTEFNLDENDRGNAWTVSPELLQVGFWSEAADCFRCVVFRVDQETIPVLRRLGELTGYPVAHFASADRHTLDNIGVTFPSPWIDTFTLTRWHHPTLDEYGLKELAAAFLGYPAGQSFSQLWGQGKASELYVRPEFQEYSARDTWLNRELLVFLGNKNPAACPWLQAQEILYRAERTGFPVDIPGLQEREKLATVDMAEQERAIGEFTGELNLNSSPQLLAFLYRPHHVEVISASDTEVQAARAKVGDAEKLWEKTAEEWAARPRKKNRQGVEKPAEIPSRLRVEQAEIQLTKRLTEYTALCAAPCLDLPWSPVTKKGPAQEGKYSTDSGALEWLLNYCLERGEEFHREASALGLLLEWRKTRSSMKYITKLQSMSVLHPDGVSRVHCTLKRGTESGRLAATGPELQQIPKDKRKDRYDLRRVFIPTPGYKLVVLDYSQLEMRGIADILSRDFSDESMTNDVLAADCHSANALRIFGSLPGFEFLTGVKPGEVKEHSDPRVRATRDYVKAVAYGLNYGKGAKGLSTLLDGNGKPIGVELAERVIAAYMELYPGLPKYQAWVWECVDSGRISTPFGRSRPITFDTSKYDKIIPPLKFSKKMELARKSAWRSALNFPLQGGGADIVDMAMLDACAAIGDRGRLLMQVHDELIFEVREEDADWVKEQVMLCMRRVGVKLGMVIPLDCSGAVADSWAEGK